MELIPHAPTELIMIDDFNCVLTNSDCSGHRTSSRALEMLIQGLRLIDVWDSSINMQAYTSYTSTRAARLDRIYATEEIGRNKQGVETLAAAFIDHLAVLLGVKLLIPFTYIGRGRWRMNITYLTDLPF